MNRCNKLYNKALKLSGKGEIDKAIEYCEKSISENIKSKEAINLKAELYYLKGDYESCKSLWKLNLDINNDSASSEFLKALKHDTGKLYLFKTAQELIKELNIEDGYALLKKCEESSFNCINVYNYIALCNYKKGNYDATKKYLQKVFKMDKRNKMAEETLSKLKEFGIYDKKKNKKFLILAASAALFLLICFCYFKIPHNMFSYNKKKNQTVKISKEKSKPQKSKQEEKKEVFPKDEINNALSNKDFDKIYNFYKEYYGKEENDENKKLIDSCKNFLQSYAADFYYEKGLNLLGSKDYKGACDNLSKAYEFGSSNSKYGDIIYLLGESVESSVDGDSALKYYDEYENKFKGGPYEAGLFYRKALIYKKDNNMQKARQYAQKIEDKYPNSDYNNSIIKDILK